MAESCIFCKIGNGDLPSDKVFDDGEAFAIRDIHPKAPTHVLVVPHTHIEALAEGSAAQRDAAAHCLAVAPRIAKDLGVTSYRLVVNQGPDSGQEVPHFHLHILGGRRLGAMG